MGRVIEIGESTKHEREAIDQLAKELPAGWFLTTSIPKERFGQELDSVLACPEGVYFLEFKASDNGLNVTPKSEPNKWEGLARGEDEGNPFLQGSSGKNKLYGHCTNFYISVLDKMRSTLPWFDYLIVIMNPGVTLHIDNLFPEEQKHVATIETVETAIKLLRGRKKKFTEIELLGIIATLQKVFHSRDAFDTHVKELCVEYGTKNQSVHVEKNISNDSSSKIKNGGIPSEAAAGEKASSKPTSDPITQRPENSCPKTQNKVEEAKETTKTPHGNWNPASSSTRVFIGTTQGPAELLSLETPPEISLSLMRVGNTTTAASNSADYDAFVTTDTGVIASRFGKGPYRANISTDIHDGNSWHLGMFAAHCLHSQGKLAGEEDKAGAAIWVTGAISTARGLPVGPVEQIPRKIQHSEQLFSDILRQGIKLTIVVPEANASELPKIEAQISGIAHEGRAPRVIMAKNCAQMCQDVLGVGIELSPESRGTSDPHLPHGQDDPELRSLLWKVGGLAVAALVAIVLFLVMPTPSPQPTPSAPINILLEPEKSPAPNHNPDPVSREQPRLATPAPENILLYPGKAADRNHSPDPVQHERRRIGPKVDLGIQWDKFD